MSGMRPLILVSAARSGSKLLRDLLGASTECAVVPFDVNFVWRHGNEARPDDALPADAADDRAIRYIRRTIPRLAGLAPGDARLLVEKTVSNSLRVPFVARVFPEARFVWLVRDGRAVAESTRRVWNEPPERGYLLEKLRYFPVRDFRYALWYLANRLRPGRDRVWGPRYPGIEADLASLDLLDVCARQWAACNAAARSAFAALPPDRVFELRYEALVGGGERLAALCEFAGLRDPGPVLAARDRTVDGAYLERWRGALSDVEAERLNTLLRGALRELGYTT